MKYSIQHILGTAFMVLLSGVSITTIHAATNVREPGEAAQKVGWALTEHNKIRKNTDVIIEGVMNLFDSEDSSSNPDPNINPSPNPSVPSVTGSLSVSGLLGNTNLPYSQNLKNSLSNCLRNKSVYKIAQDYTGIPWEVLAGIHYTETGSSCSSNQSLVSGRVIGDVEPDVGKKCSSSDTGLGKPYPYKGGCAFRNLLDTAVYAGNHLKSKNDIGQPDGIPRTLHELVRATSHYNGGGNQNCRGGTPYGFCPPLYYGEDDTYVFNKNPDGRHEVMYIRYCADGKTCAELGKPNPVHQVYGVLTIAAAISTL